MVEACGKFHIKYLEVLRFFISDDFPWLLWFTFYLLPFLLSRRIVMKPLLVVCFVILFYYTLC